MKKLALIIAISSMTQAFSATVTCISKSEARQGGAKLPVAARIDFRDDEDESGNRVLKNVVGHVAVRNNFDGDDKIGRSDDYYSIFNIKKMKAKAKYKARVYKNHSKFEDYDSTASNSTDGGGMWGYLAVEKYEEPKGGEEKSFSAHYVFQSGDHMGGTVDFDCKSSRW
ncbi:MAG: hypothetical protein HOE90_03060 [Bacteriovoracaceae bacterium]|nr:hypothetical protein [Bacteriovoracaceae bacterium]